MTEIALPASESAATLWAGSEADMTLLAELRPLVVRTARLCVGTSSAIAEDAAQEALMELSSALPSLKDRQAAPAFAARIAARVAMRMERRERRWSHLGFTPASDAPAEARDESSDHLELKQAFDALPPRQRATAVLRLYVGLSEQETAAALDCSVGTVKRQLHNARERLSATLRNGQEAP